MANALLTAALSTVCVTTLLVGTRSIFPVSGGIGLLFDLAAIYDWHVLLLECSKVD